MSPHAAVSTEAAEVALYSGGIVLGALAGALVPILSGARRLLSFLAFAAGVLLGAAFFNMLPEAFHAGGYRAFTFVPVGFLVLFFLERHVLAHVCEEPLDCPDHPKGSALGTAAFVGLAVHTLFDGVALGSATHEGVGLTACLAIAAHKVPSSLSLSAILLAEGRSTRGVLLLVTLFGLMVPAGAGLYFLLDGVTGEANLAPPALAFSAGTFLYVAVSDLLPHVNRHGGGGATRLRHLAALVAGVLAMFLLARVVGHPH